MRAHIARADRACSYWEPRPQGANEFFGSKTAREHRLFLCSAAL